MDSRQPLSTIDVAAHPVLRSAGAFARLSIMLLLACFVPLAAYLAVRVHGPQFEHKTYDHLASITALKTAHLETWLSERQDRARALASSPVFSDLARALRQDDSEHAMQAFDALFAVAQEEGRYDSLQLVGGNGELLLSSGRRRSIAPETLSALPIGLGDGSERSFSRLIVDSGGVRHVDVVIVLPRTDAVDPHAARFLILGAAAEDFLLPLLRGWPTASRSGETFLIRRAGTTVDYLSETLRASVTLVPRRSLSSDEAAVAAVALEAFRPGTARAMGHRGESVYAAFRPVAGTDWVLVAQQACDEARAPLRSLGYSVGAMTLLAVLVVGAVIARMWRLRDRTRQLVSAARSDAMLRRFYDMPFVGISMRPLSCDSWSMVNDYLCQLFGYTRDEMLKLRWQEVCHPDDIGVTADAFGRLERGESDSELIDKRFVRKDGSVLHAEVNIRSVRDVDGKPEFFFAAVRDVTAQKAAEARIRRLTSIYSALSETNQAIVRSTSEDELFPQICRFAVDFGGMQMAWVGMLDPVSQWVRPAASYGVGADFLTLSQVSADPHKPHGHGVTGIAIRTEAPCWMQDYLNEASAMPWREFAETHHWRSAAALPLYRGGTVVGALVLFSTEVAAFDEQIRALLTEMAQDVSFAMTQFVKEQARTRAEAELRLAAQVFEQSAEAVVISNPDHAILKVNRAFSEITGYEEAEVLGLSPVVLAASPEDVERYPALLDEIRRTGAWQGEMFARRKNGEMFPQLLSISRVLDADGRVSHNVVMFRDISEQRQSQQHIQRLAHFDALTGLPNRRLLEDRVSQVLNRVSRNGERMSLVFIDLDRFKNVNDSLGHRVGDELLIQVAGRLRETLREDDTVARLGGDEFILVLPDTGVKGSSRVAEKVMAALSQPYRIDQHELIVTPSMGVAIYPDDGANYEVLSRCADAAMYRAKDAGRNTFRFFTREMQEHSDRVLSLENALRRALESEQLQLHYQPQISLETNRVVGVEALLRWTHPEFGTISPGEFIPIAEDSGLILAVGEWVLRTAIRQLKIWQSSGADLFNPLVMAVNISAVQFLRGGLPDLITQILAEYGLPHDCLELELTEGVALGNPNEAIQLMEDLHERGVRLSIDDFGTGYSSLSYLKRFKAYKLKIDQSFVRDISSDPDDKAIVEAIISMARSLGMRTIAEGVETAEQMAYLYDRDCDEAQGYFIAQPMPADAFEDFVRNFRLLG